jgi:UDP-sugar transporter A1/2/3
MVVSIVLATAAVPANAFSGWSLLESFALAGPPAAVYAFRSLFKQAAYRRCDGVTFNIVNQTKVVFCAASAWLLVGEGQSWQQIAALLCAVLAGVLLVTPGGRLSQGKSVAPKDEGSSNSDDCGSNCRESKLEASAMGDDAAGWPESPRTGGLLALATAACSGLAAALSQVAMRGSTRPSALFNLELALWGVPLIALTGGAGAARPAAALRGWQGKTVAPVVLQAAGGLMVSALVKQRGGVAMGLCTVVGIAVSALVDAAFTRRVPSLRQALAAMLCLVSVFAHQRGVEAQAAVVPQPTSLTITWLPTTARVLG